MENKEKLCGWWLMCPNAATKTEPHPILGNVPICDRCEQKLRDMDADTHEWMQDA